jgi:hypothetical protein
MPVVWAAAIDDHKPQPRQKQGLCKQLKKVTAGARTNASLGEVQALEELVADYQELFEKKALTTGANRKYTTGLMPATPGSYTSRQLDSL